MRLAAPLDDDRRRTITIIVTAVSSYCVAPARHSAGASCPANTPFPLACRNRCMEYQILPDGETRRMRERGKKRQRLSTMTPRQQPILKSSRSAVEMAYGPIRRFIFQQQQQLEVVDEEPAGAAIGGIEQPGALRRSCGEEEESSSSSSQLAFVAISHPS
jgi:hypothetical protein